MPQVHCMQCRKGWHFGCLECAEHWRDYHDNDTEHSVTVLNDIVYTERARRRPWFEAPRRV